MSVSELLISWTFLKRRVRSSWILTKSLREENSLSLKIQKCFNMQYKLKKEDYFPLEYRVCIIGKASHFKTVLLLNSKTVIKFI